MKTITHLKQLIRLSSFVALLTLTLHNYAKAQCTTAVSTIYEDFVSGSFPSCWTTDVTQFYASAYISGQKIHMTTDNNQYTSAVSYVVMPKVSNCKGILSFYAERGFPPFVGTAIQIGAVSSPTNLGSFVLLGTYSAPYTTGINITLNMSTYTGNFQYIAFKLVEPGSGTNKMMLDNINYVAGCESTTVTAIAQNFTAQLASNGTYTASAASVNNNSTSGCGAPDLSLNTSTFTCANIGANPVILTATDNMGNTSTANAIITILPAINNETVTPSTTNLCNPGVATITTGSSVSGVNYYLRNDANNAVLVGPIIGTGSPITFNAGTLSSTTTFNVFGQTTGVPDPPIGLSFDGADDNVQIACPSTYNYAAGYSIEGWVKAPNSGTTSRPIFCAGTSTISDIEIYQQGVSNKIFVVHNRGKAGITTSAKGFVIPPANVWYHLAITYNGSLIKCYINGIEQTATETVTGMALTKTSGAALTMGKVNGSAAGNWGFNTFQGQMDDVRFWSTTRTTAQILANKDYCLNTNEMGLVTYYKLDDTGSALTVDAFGTNHGTLTNMTLGTAWVTGNISCVYNTTNSCTLEMTQLATITVGSDNVAPVANVATLPNITAQCSVTSLTAPTALDNCSGTITGTKTVTLPITTSGTTVVTWTYNDGNGNTSIQTQNVIINDNIAPVASVTSLPNITSQCSVTTLTAPTATDNCSGTITGTKTVTLPITTQGTTVVTWTYNDGNGNTSTQMQNVIINDNIAPVANATSLPNITAQCSVSTLTAPTATDNCAGSITGTHSTTLPITTQGTTIVTWAFSDGHGNTSTQTQNVIINDNLAPVANATALSNITDQCSVSTLTAPTATDNCAGTITGTHNVTLPITTQGTTAVTWTFSDGHGNTSTQIQNVVINDNLAPIPDATSLPNIGAQCSVSALMPPTATDNCAGTVAGTHAVTMPITTQGTTVVTWTFSDGHGNTSTLVQNVVINDNLAPVANISTLPDVNEQCSVTTLTAPEATDNCAGLISGTHNLTLPIITQGTTVVTWSYDDGNGNISTQNQNIIILDNTNPTPDVTTLNSISEICSVNTLTAPTATDNCSGLIVGTHATSLPITTLGTTVVTWTYTDGNGNSTTQNQTITISPVDASVTLNGPTLSANFTSANSYQWIDCNNGNSPISGATSSTYTPSPGGNFAVIVSVGTCSETSVCTFVSTSGVQELMVDNIRLYPNPSSTTVSVNSTSKIDKIEIYDSSGKLIGTITESTFSVEELANGIYFLNISTDSETIQRKFIKH